jgi:pyruvate formate lyase activating enzyme
MIAIGNFLKLTLIDYPGELACEVFCQSCNFRCLYCHNIHLVIPEYFSSPIDIDNIFEYIEKNKNKLTGVVISGGEPLFSKNILNFLKEIRRKFAIKIKIDTNGSFPELTRQIIESNLADCIAIDIKASPENYDKVCGTKTNPENILTSIEILQKSKIEKAFRMTVVKGLIEKKDIEFAKKITEGKIIFQNYRRPNFLPVNFPAFEEMTEENFRIFVN